MEAKEFERRKERKASQSQITMNWSHFESSLSNIARDLCGENELTDVTLACPGGITFRAHKLILASCSDHFRTLFRDLNEISNPVIYLRNFNADDVQALLTFIYSGEVTIPPYRLESLVAAATDLSIEGLGESTDAHADEFSQSETFAWDLEVDDDDGGEMEETELKEEVFEDFSRLSKRKNPDLSDIEYNDDMEGLKEGFPQEAKKSRAKKQFGGAERKSNNEIVSEHFNESITGEVPVEICESVFDKYPHIIANGYLYVLNHVAKRSQKKYFACIRYHRSENCPANLILDFDLKTDSLIYRKSHNHAPSEEDIAKKKLMESLRKFALDDPSKPVVDVVQEYLETVPEHWRKYLTTFDNMKKTVKGSRKRMGLDI